MVQRRISIVVHFSATHSAAATADTKGSPGLDLIVGLKRSPGDAAGLFQVDFNLCGEHSEFGGRHINCLARKWVNTLHTSRLISGTYSKQRECLLVALVALHLDVNIDRVLCEINLCVVLVLCKNTQDDIGLSLIPIGAAIDHFLSLNDAFSLLLLLWSASWQLTWLLAPTNKCFPSLHPSIFRNSSKSKTLREQQLQPLDPSWKMGEPGWWRHVASAPDPREVAWSFHTRPQPRLLQVVPSGTGTDSSSSSSTSGFFSSSSSFLGSTATATGASGFLPYTSTPSSVTWVAWAVTGTSAFFAASEVPTAAGAATGSVEWRPKVQPGRARNSSKSDTRFLQQDQPFKPNKGNNT